MHKANFSPDLIAPCGINCGACIAYFGYTATHERRKHPCNGCRSRQRPCAFIQQDCPSLKQNEIKYCYQCETFPCERLTTLDGRYRARYGLSLIENLRFIQEHGMDNFLSREEERWKCPRCGGTVCIHDKKCYSCERTPVPRSP